MSPQSRATTTSPPEDSSLWTTARGALSETSAAPQSMATASPVPSSATPMPQLMPPASDPSAMLMSHCMASGSTSSPGGTSTSHCRVGAAPPASSSATATGTFTPHCSVGSVSASISTSQLRVDGVSAVAWPTPRSQSTPAAMSVRPHFTFRASMPQASVEGCAKPTSSGTVVQSLTSAIVVSAAAESQLLPTEYLENSA
mmetsp:Transcript_19817/g.55097  ORF Transcript_19817/g.55097 Transcript_19817/m.55097 type:complete len:200 (-) Transcript_19817:750-1349(-)